MNKPAYYARTGTVGRDLLALLHPPYTAWHLSYVAIGAGLAARLDWAVLGGTLLAFALGTGVGAHALDELWDRPLGTGLSRATLKLLAWLGMGGAALVAVVGAVVVSPWVSAWAIVGIVLAIGYPLERPSWLHTDLGFALSWGAFPVLVGSWAQELALSPAAVLMAAVAILVSLAQRSLSTPARFVRRRTVSAGARFTHGSGEEAWGRERLLATWEHPLRLLGWGMVGLAAALLARHL